MFRHIPKRQDERSTCPEWYSWVASKHTGVVLDGGLGSMLAQRGNDLGEGSMWSGKLLHTNPDELQAVAWLWLEAGADIITTATYQVSIDLFQKEFSLSEEEAKQVILSSWGILDSSRKRFWSSLSLEDQQRRYPTIAVSFGPLSAVLDGTSEYSGLYNNVSKDKFREFHHQRANIFTNIPTHGGRSNESIMCYETIGNIVEGAAISEAMSSTELRNVPYWVSFQCRDESRLASGASISSAVDAVLCACHYGNLVAIGVNCVDPRHIVLLIANVQKSLDFFMGNREHNRWRVDTLAYPNSGENWSGDGWVWHAGQRLSPASWAYLVRSSGATLLGGCCRTTPAHISALSAARLEA